MYARLIRWAFARFYREFAWTYDVVAALVSARRWGEWTLAALPYLQGSVLELGCGTGHLQRALAEQARSTPAIGLDASPQMLARTGRRVAHAGTVAKLVHADARALPFSSASFDTLVATFPSEYIAAHPTLTEARRVLRPGGQIVIMLAAEFTRDGVYQRLIDLAYRITLQRPIRPLHITEPPQSLIGQRLTHAGFAVEERWELVSAGTVQLHMIFGTVPGCRQLSMKN